MIKDKKLIIFKETLNWAVTPIQEPQKLYK